MAALGSFKFRCETSLGQPAAFSWCGRSESAIGGAAPTTSSMGKLTIVDSEWTKTSMNKFPMTAAGYSVLENELKHRIHIERPRLIERLQEAIADDSNLAENPEYQAVKSEQEINEARIVELEDKLARADVIDVSKLSGDTIKFGATVSLIEKDTGEHKVWQIVGEPEADANKGNLVTFR